MRLLPLEYLRRADRRYLGREIKWKAGDDSFERFHEHTGLCGRQLARRVYRQTLTAPTITSSPNRNGAVGCWAYAMRHFHDALETDRGLMGAALALIACLYRIAKIAREREIERKRAAHSAGTGRPASARPVARLSSANPRGAAAKERGRPRRWRMRSITGPR